MQQIPIICSASAAGTVPGIRKYKDSPCSQKALYHKVLLSPYLSEHPTRGYPITMPSRGILSQKLTQESESTSTVKSLYVCMFTIFRWHINLNLNVLQWSLVKRVTEDLLPVLSPSIHSFPWTKNAINICLHYFFSQHNFSSWKRPNSNVLFKLHFKCKYLNQWKNSILVLKKIPITSCVTLTSPLLPGITIALEVRGRLPAPRILKIQCSNPVRIPCSVIIL